MDMELAGNSPAGGGSVKIPVTIDVCLRSTSTARREEVVEAVVQYIEDVGSLVYLSQAIELPSAEEDPFLHAHVESAVVADLGECTQSKESARRRRRCQHTHLFVSFSLVQHSRQREEEKRKKYRSKKLGTPLTHPSHPRPLSHLSRD
jgi:hypothetical protein